MTTAAGDPVCQCGCGGWFGQCVRWTAPFRATPFEFETTAPFTGGVYELDPRKMFAALSPKNGSCDLGDACFICNPRNA